jgi:hypothetical protein
MSECWKEFVAKFPFVYLVSFLFSNLAACAATCLLKLVLVLTIVLLLFGQYFNFRIWQFPRSFLIIFYFLKVVLELTIILLFVQFLILKSDSF